MESTTYFGTNTQVLHNVLAGSNSTVHSTLMSCSVLRVAVSAGSDGLKTGGRVPDLMGEAVDVRG
jgi:hypothetical protein